MKSAILTFSFCVVAYAIYSLKQNPIENRVNAFLNAPKAPKPLFWCETRVNEVEIPGVLRMYQEGLKWFRDTPDGVTVELGFVPVEKWFAEYCKLKVEGISEGFVSATEDTGKVLARVGFVKGPDKTFTSVDADLYGWGEWNFRSQKLLKALEDLKELPKIGGSEKGQAPGH